MKNKAKTERFEITIPEKHVIEALPPIRKTTYFFDGEEYEHIYNIFRRMFNWKEEIFYAWLGISEEAIAKFDIAHSADDGSFTTEGRGFSYFLKLMGYPVESDPDADIKFYLDLLRDQEKIREKAKKVFALSKSVSTRRKMLKGPNGKHRVIIRTITYKSKNGEWVDREYEVDGEKCSDAIQVFQKVFNTYGNFWEWLGFPKMVLEMLGNDPEESDFYIATLSHGCDFIVLYKLGYKKYGDFYTDVLDDPSKVRAEIKKYFVIKEA